MKRFMSVFYERVHWGTIPKWWMGRAYTDQRRREEVCVLLPFNWPVGLGRSLWFWLQNGPLNSRYAEIHSRKLNRVPRWWEHYE